MGSRIHHRSMAALAAALLMVLTAAVVPARASFTMTAQEVGSDVVITGSGTLNVDALDFFSPGPDVGGLVAPAAGLILLGSGNLDEYTGATGPVGLGPGGLTFASSSSGDAVGVGGSNIGNILVPRDYISGSPLSGSATFAGQTLAGLGFDPIPATYTYTWGFSAQHDSLTVVVVPEPAWLGLLAVGAAMMLTSSGPDRHPPPDVTLP